MDIPTDVIQSYQTKIAGEYRRPIDKYIRITVVSLIVLLLISNYILGIDLYHELSTLPKMLLGLAIVETLFYGKKECDHICPFKIELYDSFMVIDEEKRYYHQNLTRRNICKIDYQDLEKIEYEAETKMFYIYGTKMEVKWFNYTKDGVMASEPTKQKIAKEALWHFRLLNDDGDSIVHQLKQYANIVVLDRKTGRNLV